MKCFKATHFSTKAPQMLHGWHLSHHKHDGKCTTEVFKTKNYQRSPPLEGAPAGDITLLVSPPPPGLKKPLWILKVMTLKSTIRTQWGSDTETRGADPEQKDRAGFPSRTECGQQERKQRLTRLHSNTLALSRCLICCPPHILCFGEIGIYPLCYLFQITRVAHWQVNWFAWGHTNTQYQSQDLNSALLAQHSICFHYHKLALWTTVVHSQPLTLPLYNSQALYIALAQLSSQKPQRIGAPGWLSC